MSKRIQKALQNCLSKLKIPNRQIQISMRGCKHVKTTSFAAIGNAAKANDAVTLSDIDRFLFENFKSLYLQEECEEGIPRKKTPSLLDSPPDNGCRSSRFLVESGTPSSRVTDEPFSASATNKSSTTSEKVPEDFVALLTYSPSPYDEFRRSMQGVVEVRLEHKGKVDWTFLEEMLFCYLDLNNKKWYSYILRAFVDVIVVLRQSPGKTPASSQPFTAELGVVSFIEEKT